MQTILLLIILVLKFMVSLSDSSVIEINDSYLDELYESGNKKAERLKKLTCKPDRLIASMRTASVFVSTLAGTYSAVFFYGSFCGFLRKYVPYFVSGGISILVISLVVSFVLVSFCELLPKHISAENPEKLALRLSRFTYFVCVVFTPFALSVRFITNAVLGIMKINPENTAETVTEEEILMMSDAGAENGAIDEDENRIIKNVFEFDDMTACQICTHRTDVSVLWYNDSPEQWEEEIHRTRHSNFPVCDKSVDDVIGVLNAKDYFRLDSKDRENIMKNAVHEPFFVHENLKADRLFAQMKKNGADRFAVVVDEYGGMSGIITVTDLAEQLLGNFADDDDEQYREQIVKESENTWIISGAVTVGEVNESLDITLPADKYDIFSGYVMALLDEIPHDSQQISVESDGLHIDILKINHHRIEMCRVSTIE